MTFDIMDYVLVSGVDDEVHFRNVDMVFQRFQKHGLRVKPPKCFFYCESVVYMGRRLSSEGMQPTEEHLDAITNTPRPQNVNELRSFLGLVNFQAQFIPNLSTMAHPMYALLSSKTRFSWSPEVAASFEAVKKAVVDAT